METLNREIWLSGGICTGKDYVADVLAQDRGYWRLGVGQLIAEEIEATLQLPEGFIYSSIRNKDAFRSALQAHGNLRRSQDPFYWLKKWCAARDEHKDQSAVQTSCRFIFEGNAAISRGALVIRLTIPDNLRRNRISRMYPSHDKRHDIDPAEGEIDKVPYHAHMSGNTPRSQIIPMLENISKMYCSGRLPVRFL